MTSPEYEVSIRQAAAGDYSTLARFRWDHKAEDGEIPDGTAFASFAETYRAQLAAPARDTDTVHWIAEGKDEPVGAMTVRIVEKECSPGKRLGRWGYLTNVFVVPACRNHGIGSSLLQATMAWARSEELELLIVWPSEASMDFYRRAGFAGSEAPLEYLIAATD